ncbi:MAG TPA: glycosyltransferase [Burkholderiales bacterium]|nr:glycosyltransferase [Burkholderiales bacterium]
MSALANTMPHGLCPLVSIVIPCFNGESFVAQAIESALAQTYERREVIVVDDGSTDRSSAIIDSFAPRVRVVRQPNLGLSAARNAGIQVSNGSYIAFLDCDDYWDRIFAARMVSALETGGASIAYCGWQNIGLVGGRSAPFIPPDYESAREKILCLLSDVRWPVHAAMVRRQVIEQVGGFNPMWSSCEDFDFWIRAAISHRLVRVPEVLAFYRHHGDGQMTRKRAQVAEQFWRVQRRYFQANPHLIGLLGADLVRRITDGALLERGYACFWDRDLSAAQKIFRNVMKTGYGSLRDWKYLLPALLPLGVYRRVVNWVDSRH